MASPFAGSSFSTGTSADALMAFWPRQAVLFPIAAPRESHVRYAETASTSGEVGVGRSSVVSGPPVAFSLRRKQSVMRSPRLNSLAERRLYSGDTPAMLTSGDDFSRWAAFMWQVLHDMPPGASPGSPPAVVVEDPATRPASSVTPEL